ncbi:MAG: SDR family oxidoreductase [Alphaproteobacteria bacterium]|nr:SDR family oxidoreductase [Alphaproteobacteria bacterium]
MSFDFTGRRVVVCGGSRGIGRSIALGFAQAGADVSVCAREPKALEETRAEIAKSNHKAHAASCDLGDAAAIKGYIEAAAKALGGIDVLVNNASGFGSSDDEAGWAVGLNVDVMAMVRASHAALPWLEKAGAAHDIKGGKAGASIINMSSISGLRPAGRQPPYGAVKAAMIHYTLSQAATLARKNIRVNCIAPGSIEFPGGVWDKRKTDAPQLYNAIHKSIPFGRLGHPEEIATVALFLASPLANWVTGQTISVDGGQLLGA